MNVENALWLLKAEMNYADMEELANRLINTTCCHSGILRRFRDDNMELLKLFQLDIDTLKDYYFRFHEELTNKQFSQWGEWSTRKYGRSSYIDKVPDDCGCPSCKNERDYYIARTEIMGRAFDLTVCVDCDSILEELEELIKEGKRLRAIHDKNLNGCLYRNT